MLYAGLDGQSRAKVANDLGFPNDDEEFEAGYQVCDFYYQNYIKYQFKEEFYTNNV